MIMEAADRQANQYKSANQTKPFDEVEDKAKEIKKLNISTRT